jgi:hypothetical protein
VLIPVGIALALPALQAARPEAISPEQGIGIAMRVVAVAGLIYAALVLWSALLPQRGIPDRLAGTWLVPR